MKKAVSPLLAGVLLVAFTVGIGTLTTGFVSTAFNTAESMVTNKTTEASDCSSAEIVIDDVFAKAGDNGTVVVPVRNSGSIGNLQITSAQLYDRLGNNFSASNMPVTGFGKGSIVNLNFQMPKMPNTTADSSGLGNTGNCTNMGAGSANKTCSFTLSGKSNAGLDFDYVNDYINYGTGAVFQPLDQITVEAWIKPMSSDAYTKYLVGKYNTTNSYGLYVANTNQVSFEIMGATASRNIDFSTWTHVAGVYNGSEVLIYINGSHSEITDALKTGSIRYDDTKPLLIGALALNFQGVPSSLYNGSADEIAIWNRSLSSEEINKTMNGISSSLMNTTGLVGYWRFDEGRGVLQCSDFSKVIVSTNCGGISAVFEKLPRCS